MGSGGERVGGRAGGRGGRGRRRSGGGGDHFDVLGGQVVGERLHPRQQRQQSHLSTGYTQHRLQAMAERERGGEGGGDSTRMHTRVEGEGQWRRGVMEEWSSMCRWGVRKDLLSVLEGRGTGGMGVRTSGCTESGYGRVGAGGVSGCVSTAVTVCVDAAQWRGSALYRHAVQWMRTMDGGECLHRRRTMGAAALATLTHTSAPAWYSALRLHPLHTTGGHARRRGRELQRPGLPFHAAVLSRLASVYAFTPLRSRLLSCCVQPSPPFPSPAPLPCFPLPRLAASCDWSGVGEWGSAPGDVVSFAALHKPAAALVRPSAKTQSRRANDGRRWACCALESFIGAMLARLTAVISSPPRLHRLAAVHAAGRVGCREYEPLPRESSA